MGIEVCLSDLGTVDQVTASYLPVVDAIRKTDVLVLVFEGDQFTTPSLTYATLAALKKSEPSSQIVTAVTFCFALSSNEGGWAHCS